MSSAEKLAGTRRCKGERLAYHQRDVGHNGLATLTQPSRPRNAACMHTQ